MADLNTTEKQILEKIFQMGNSGTVLNFSNRTMREFFRDDVRIDIDAPEFSYGSDSKANLMRGFWLSADNKTVGQSIMKLIDYIRGEISLDNLSRNDFPKERINAAKEIAGRLLGVGGQTMSKQNRSEAIFRNGDISITLQENVFDHIQKLFDDGHYFSAVEEACKKVRQKLKDITGEEKASNAFATKNQAKIFGHKPKNKAEADFFDSVKFLHMSIQFLRNEKVHTPAYNLDENLAIHYIALASLAYDLITRNELNQEISKDSYDHTV